MGLAASQNRKVGRPSLPASTDERGLRGLADREEASIEGRREIKASVLSDEVAHTVSLLG
jgi:hypothetical protein